MINLFSTVLLKVKNDKLTRGVEGQTIYHIVTPKKSCSSVLSCFPPQCPSEYSKLGGRIKAVTMFIYTMKGKKNTNVNKKWVDQPAISQKQKWSTNDACMLCMRDCSIFYLSFSSLWMYHLSIIRVCQHKFLIQHGE